MCALIACCTFPRPGGQVIPREHVEDAAALDETHEDMVKEMVRVGHCILDEVAGQGSPRQLQFHRPPFTSVKHLHMHCMSLPLNGVLAELKHKPFFSMWVLPVEKLMEQLRPSAKAPQGAA